MSVFVKKGSTAIGGKTALFWTASVMRQPALVEFVLGVKISDASMFCEVGRKLGSLCLCLLFHNGRDIGNGLVEIGIVSRTGTAKLGDVGAGIGFG